MLRADATGLLEVLSIFEQRFREVDDPTNFRQAQEEVQILRLDHSVIVPTQVHHDLTPVHHGRVVDHLPPVREEIVDDLLMTQRSAQDRQLAPLRVDNEDPAADQTHSG